jgi:predicted enzyme related to lactoylglutathione lyase
MADPTTPATGQIGWADLTVPDAESVRDFYQHVTGWSASPVDMGGYQDYCMVPPGSEAPVSGICHARGGNAGLPPVWLIYITVPDLDESVRRCLERGGKLVLPPKSMGQARYCVIQDPAGAAAGLYEGPKA